MVEVVPHFGTSTAGTWKSMGYKRFVDGAYEAWSTWKGHQGHLKENEPCDGTKMAGHAGWQSPHDYRDSYYRDTPKRG